MNTWNEVLKALDELDERFPEHCPFSIELFGDGSGSVRDSEDRRIASFSSYYYHVTDSDRIAAIRGITSDKLAA